MFTVSAMCSLYWLCIHGIGNVFTVLTMYSRYWQCAHGIGNVVTVLAMCLRYCQCVHDIDNVLTEMCIIVCGLRSRLRYALILCKFSLLLVSTSRDCTLFKHVIFVYHFNIAFQINILSVRNILFLQFFQFVIQF